jgi:hypothetical protein
MALSLSKRKNIIDSRLVSLSCDWKSKRNSELERTAFLSRFLEGSAASLRSLEVAFDDDAGKPHHLVFLKAGNKLESLTFLRDHTYWRNFSAANWSHVLHGCAFKDSLKYLTLRIDGVNADFLEKISQTFRNLEEARFPLLAALGDSVGTRAVHKCIYSSFSPLIDQFSGLHSRLGQFR